MTVGSLFSGIGGLDLGLERAGFRILWQCECDPFARKILAKHWPGVPCYQDVRDIDERAERPDLLCGGFPCQPVAHGGRKLVDQDERWLWPEFARVIRDLRPQYVLLENVAALLDRGMDLVLSSLAEMGFDAEWGVLSACMFGAPHTRERMFLVAYPHCLDGQAGFRVFPDRTCPDEPGDPGSDPCHWMEPFTGIPGVDHGVPARMDRLRTLGNAVVPQIAYWLGQLVLELES